MKNKLVYNNMKQQIRSLTLDAISPLWCQRLAQLPIPVSFKWLRWCFEITFASKCVVGEAHGFSSAYTYTCKECGKIGERFAFYFIMHSYTKLTANKDRFVKHWNEEHTHTS